MTHVIIEYLFLQSDVDKLLQAVESVKNDTEELHALEAAWIKRTGELEAVGEPQNSPCSVLIQGGDLER